MTVTIPAAAHLLRTDVNHLATLPVLDGVIVMAVVLEAMVAVETEETPPVLLAPVSRPETTACLLAILEARIISSRQFGPR